MTLDRWVLDAIVGIRTAWATDIFTVVTTVAGLAGLLSLAAVVAVALARRGYRSDAVLVVGATVSGWLVMSATKLVVGRERPPMPERIVVESTYSFPSGHAMVSAVLATVVAAVAVAHRYRHRTAVIAVGATGSLVDGASRLYLGAHWFTDVIAGWVLGVAWALAWVWSMSRR